MRSKSPSSGCMPDPPVEEYIGQGQPDIDTPSSRDAVRPGISPTMRPLTPLVLATGCTACVPIMAGPTPLALPEDSVSAIEIGAAAPRARELRTLPPEELDDPPLPRVQVHAASPFRLHDRVDAGPSFLLDLADGSSVVTGGLFVRIWTGDPDLDDIAVAVRIEAGWAWAGAGLDLVFDLGEDGAFTLGPTVLATPDLLLARFPLGAVLRLPPLDVGVEAGLTGGASFSGGVSAAPWIGVRARLSL